MANRLLITNTVTRVIIFLELPPFLPSIDELLPLPIPATLSGHLLPRDSPTFKNSQQATTIKRL